MRRLVTNPENISALQDKFVDKLFDEKFMPLFNAIEIIADSSLPATQEVPTGRIIFPDDPFVEYEERDAEWAVPLGIAIAETVVVRLFYEVPSWSLFCDRRPRLDARTLRLSELS